MTQGLKPVRLGDPFPTRRELIELLGSAAARMESRGRHTYLPASPEELSKVSLNSSPVGVRRPCHRFRPGRRDATPPPGGAGEPPGPRAAFRGWRGPGQGGAEGAMLHKNQHWAGWMLIKINIAAVVRIVAGGKMDIFSGVSSWEREIY